MSSGPTTATGKAIASANGTTHALAARAVLLPSEKLDEYESCVAGWFLTLMPRSPGEGHLVARVGDVAWRMRRLERVEERLMNAALETKVAESALAKALQAAEDALRAVQSVAALSEEVVTPRTPESVAQIASGLRFVVGMVEKVEIPAAAAAAFERATTALLSYTYADVPPEAFHSLALAARCAEGALKDLIEHQRKAVDAERERLADAVLLGENGDTKLLDRHRARLSRELAAHLGTIKLLRELVVPARGGEEHEPLPIEVRLVGRSEQK